MKIAVVLGSTRDGRVSPLVGNRVVEEGQKNYSDHEFELIDLKDYNLPILPKHIMQYDGSEEEYNRVMSLRKKLDEADGYIFVVQEYNHAMSAALKTIFEYYYTEYNNKAAGIVSYGKDGGVRAGEQLRLIFAEVRIAGVRTQPAINIFTEFDKENGFVPAAFNVERINTAIQEVIEWSTALAPLRG